MDEKKVFVRALWGDGPETISPTETLQKTRNDIRESLDNSYQPMRLLVYVWGQPNWEWLSNVSDESFRHMANLVMGVDRHLVSDVGIHNFTAHCTRECSDRGRLNWGISFWRHKLEAMKLALQDHEAIIWLDWDVHMVPNEVPEDLWHRLGKGPVYQASLRRYKRPQCHWHPRGEKQFVAHGGFQYCRSLEFIERAIWIQEHEYPTMADEIACTKAAEELTGGWQGTDHWKEVGLEPYCYDQRKKWIHRPKASDVVFRNVGRY